MRFHRLKSIAQRCRSRTKNKCVYRVISGVSESSRGSLTGGKRMYRVLPEVCDWEKGKVPSLAVGLELATGDRDVHFRCNISEMYSCDKASRISA